MNNSAHENFNDLLEQITNSEDLTELDALIHRLNAEDLQRYKTEITDSYLRIFTIGHCDLSYGNINTEDKDSIVAYLFEILASVEKVYPEKLFHIERAQCYEFQAELKKGINDKLSALQKAADEYIKAARTSLEINVCIAGISIDKMEITQQYTDDEFIRILGLFQLAFTAYSEKVLIYFLQGCFRILNFSFDKREHWHHQFFGKFTASLTHFSAKDPIINLLCSEELTRVLECGVYDISPNHADDLYKLSFDLLENLTDYSTDDSGLLNRLGSAFEKAAKQMNNNEVAEKLRFFQIAVHYFTKGQTIAPAAWTFPVYATNALKAMARHHQDKRIIIQLFEAGNTIFSKTYQHEKNFTLNLNWGEFLIEYARLAYNFQAEDILKEAALKLNIAKELGENYYELPFLLLAKVALKSGNKQESLNILNECQAIFTTEYSTYSFDMILEDEDFAPIFEDLRESGS
ncbi:hypothetical protein CLV51_10626 [Chitinophaga niastensis]|uniref:Uncharacterized protein n=1 Tax=Chitinophaga niastensis TaxID=536980 RepID=A0A2P8HDF1_CHINA|nr:hypothetical protein [Chitinophaga niastensis]PSL44161.1 hypothetical protein CLV51_10626 [Chitinophaga niastensis]